MTQREVEEIITKEIHIILGGTIEVRLDEELHNLGMDSMGFVELLIFIEKMFALKLVDSGLARDNFRTVRILANSIYEKLR